MAYFRHLIPGLLTNLSLDCPAVSPIGHGDSEGYRRIQKANTDRFVETYAGIGVKCKEASASAIAATGVLVVGYLSSDGKVELEGVEVYTGRVVERSSALRFSVFH